MEVISLGYLLVLGIRDGIRRTVPLWWLALGGTIMIGMGIYRCNIGERSSLEMLAGTLPGVVLCLIARITGKVGYGDGILLMELGICYGWRRVMFLLCMSLVILSLLALFLLMMHKVKKDTRMPFFPVLAFVFLITVIGGG